MIGVSKYGDAVQKLAGISRSKIARPGRIYGRRAPEENLAIRRDLAIALLRLHHDWPIEDLARVFHLTRHQVMRAVAGVERFNQMELARRA